MPLPLVGAGLYAFLLLAVWPLAKQVFLALGIGWLTYAGLSLVMTQLTSEVVGAWGLMPASMVQMASLLGFPQSVGIILGGISARVTLASVARLGKMTS